MEGTPRADMGTDSAEMEEFENEMVDTATTTAEDQTDPDTGSPGDGAETTADDTVTTEQGEEHQAPVETPREQWSRLVDSVWDMSHRSVMEDHRAFVEEQQRVAETRAAAREAASAAARDAVAESFGPNGKAEE